MKRKEFLKMVSTGTGMLAILKSLPDVTHPSPGAPGTLSLKSKPGK